MTACATGAMRAWRFPRHELRNNSETRADCNPEESTGQLINSTLIFFTALLRKGRKQRGPEQGGPGTFRGSSVRKSPPLSAPGSRHLRDGRNSARRSGGRSADGHPVRSEGFEPSLPQMPATACLPAATSEEGDRKTSPRLASEVFGRPWGVTAMLLIRSLTNRMPLSGTSGSVVGAARKHRADPAFFLPTSEAEPATDGAPCRIRPVSTVITVKTRKLILQ
jgi:hypothetical protein